MQYFKDRNQAGLELAKLLARYHGSHSVIVALSTNGVSVGLGIADKLHLPLGLMASSEVRLPWHEAPVMGAVNNSGEYTRNESLGEGFLEEFEGEYRSFIDQERIRASHEINLMHVSNVLKHENLAGRNIIMVDDGLFDTRKIDEVISFLKPVKYERLIAALPIATVAVIDKLHIAVDEIHCLDVKENYISTDHYYENNSLPTYEELLDTLITHDTMA